MKDVVLILGLEFLLGVDEEQCDDVVGVPFVNLPLNVDVGELRIGSLGLDRPILQRNIDAAASRISLPNQERL